MVKGFIRFICGVLLIIVYMSVLTACTSSFYCDRCGFIHQGGNGNRIVIGSVDITLCDEHNLEFFKNTEKISIDNVVSLIEKGETVKVKTVGGIYQVSSYDGKYQIDNVIFDTKDKFKNYFDRHLSSNGYVYVLTQ